MYIWRCDEKAEVLECCDCSVPGSSCPCKGEAQTAVHLDTTGTYRSCHELHPHESRSRTRAGFVEIARASPLVHSSAYALPLLPGSPGKAAALQVCLTKCLKWFRSRWPARHVRQPPTRVLIGVNRAVHCALRDLLVHELEPEQCYLHRLLRPALPTIVIVHEGVWW